jgi:hypothetical protein
VTQTGRRGAGDEQPSWSDELLDAGSTLRADLGPEAAERFDAELARFQRIRCIWYCAGCAFLFLLIFLNDLRDTSPIDWTDPESLFDVADPLLSLVVIGIYVGFLIAFARTAGPRARVMTLFVRLLATVGCLVVISAMVLWTHAVAQDPEAEPYSALFIGGGTVITLVLMLHFLACLFVVLSPREAILPLIPITLVYVAVILLWVPGPTNWKIAMLAFWPCAGGPGVLWSAWRYRRFVDRFRWKTFSGRYRDIRQDLADARRVHEALFPAPVRDGAVRLEYVYEPMRDIGGDYLFVHRRPDGGLFAAVVDVAGHGIASALAANRLHGELERLVEDHPEIEPAAAVAALNRFVHRSMAPQAIFATAVVVDLSPTGRLRYANAGHPSALRRAADGTVTELPSTCMMLGVLDAAGYESGEESIDLGPEEALILCTDGVLEAADGTGEFFGAERFVRVAADAGIGGADRVPPAVLEAVRRHRFGESTDDVLVAAVWRPVG